MRRLADSLFLIAVALWVGGLWAIGYISAPTLFASLPTDRMLAGMLAGRQFTLMAWVGMACAAYLLAYVGARRRAAAARSVVGWLVLVMLLLTLAGHFGIQPILAQIKAEAALRAGSGDVMESMLHNRFRAWHGVAGTVYLVESLLGLALVVLQRRELR